MSNFNSFFEKARFIANSAGKKTGEILEISKLKLKISQIRASIEHKYELKLLIIKLPPNSFYILVYYYNVFNAIVNYLKIIF